MKLTEETVPKFLESLPNNLEELNLNNIRLGIQHAP